VLALHRPDRRQPVQGKRVLQVVHGEEPEPSRPFIYGHVRIDIHGDILHPDRVEDRELHGTGGEDDSDRKALDHLLQPM
jgi:hypothetical protein